MYFIYLTYGPVYIFWLAIFRNENFPDALLFGFLALSVEFVIFMFPLPLGILNDTALMASLFFSIVPPFGFIAAAAVAGAINGLVLATLQWIVLTFPAGAAPPWFRAHLLGAGGAGIAIALAVYWSDEVGLSLSQNMLLWSIALPCVALPHLYLTWRVLAPAPPVAKEDAPVGAMRSAIGRTACCVLAGYALVAIGRLVVGDTTRDALIWPYHDVRHVVFGIRPGRPDAGKPIRIGDQEYLVPTEFVRSWLLWKRPDNYFAVFLSIPAELVIADDANRVTGEQIEFANEEIGISIHMHSARTIMLGGEGTEKHHLCKRQSQGRPTVCWHEDGKFELFKVPQSYDYKTSISIGIVDRVMFYVAEGDDAKLIAYCREHSQICEVEFDDEAVGVTVDLSPSLHSYLRPIVGGAERLLRRFRARADAFHQAKD